MVSMVFHVLRLEYLFVAADQRSNRDRCTNFELGDGGAQRLYSVLRTAGSEDKQKWRGRHSEIRQGHLHACLLFYENGETCSETHLHYYFSCSPNQACLAEYSGL